MTPPGAYWVLVTTFLEADVADATPQRLLTEYFQERASTFPQAQGSYRTAFPDARQFVPPQGVFLLVLDDGGAAIGCGGIRRLPGTPRTRYEVKHLWLAPSARGRGLGRQLLAELERRADAFGAAEVVVDTNDSLAAAGGLYRSSGYESIPAYNDNPNATTWYRKALG